ncbi:tRNA guanosine(34) transglycosylase Tgt [Candidatus Falkowbacteria bacterium]|jgi:queuine tRNA-ribosyltransferase|nr:tRNA guanosine(34) transglycosylase Tgt [Patescibacteria group bacterium]MDD3435170.1 tRNA guanosine(34) transglycosylase Tgt [Patescibacteria group bacterium]MDD4466706.1 tRNA guanosine(34) transglycosylase Tgt [Patescibacteria group bacterium]NCU42771.1 tRNA guanosine(34) transglycosylase Tgt [Candidatus Falkowbacteria bacterium]
MIIWKNKNGCRQGKIKTPHGFLETPFFMPDATRGAVKHLTVSELEQVGTPALVVNTFHLYLRPGIKLIDKVGGLHRLMNYSRPLLSDSGGFQVFSLIHRRLGQGDINDERARFKSPLDGSFHELTPEKSIQIQFSLGVDFMICLDDCPPNEFSRLDLEKAVERTIAWALRAKAEYQRQVKKRRLSEANRPRLLAVIQGGAEIDLRQACAAALVNIGFDGYGFGARPVDKDGNFLAAVMSKTAAAIPENSLRFALGVGLPEDIYRAYLMGWDMFDCVIPTREGRHGKLFSFKPDFKDFKAPGQRSKIIKKAPDFYQAINILRSEYASDQNPINSASKIPELRNYSRAYLHHLFKSGEPLGQRLASLNNLEFFNELLEKLKKINA